MNKLYYLLKSHFTKTGYLQSLKDYERALDFAYPEDAQFQEDVVSAKNQEGLSWIFGIPLLFLAVFYSEDLKKWKIIYNPKNDWGIRKISDFGWFRIDSQSDMICPKLKII